MFKAACVQLRSTDDVAENIATTSALIREAAGQGAQFIATPENTTLMAPDGGAKLDKSFTEGSRSRAARLSCAGRRTRHLAADRLAGDQGQRRRKTANRSFLIDPKGAIAARYDKIHLFDVDLPSGENYRESNTVAGGNRAVLAETPWGKLGMTICYDLRFPHLYRKLAQAGAIDPHRALRLHRDHGQGALACAAAGPRHRERRLRHRPGAGRHSRQWPARPMATA